MDRNRHHDVTDSHGPDRSRLEHYLGIFLLALATLLLELALTRILSVALWYHFGFLVISTALLGFGASGVALALWKWLREQAQLERALALLSAAFGLVTLASFWTLQRIPFDPFSLLADRRQLVWMPLYYVTIAAPFFCSGLAIALLLARRSQDVHRLYCFDLIGAGAGCAAIALLMPVLGGAGTVVAAASLGLLAAAVFGATQSRGPAGAALALAVAGLLLARSADGTITIAVTPNKRRSATAPIYAKWNTFSRVEVYELPAAGGEPSSRRLFIIDSGTAATGIRDLRPDVRSVLAGSPELPGVASSLAFLGKPRPSVLIIGSGAGAEVLEALKYGAASITAVEINPIITDLVTGTMSDYWGGLFTQPEVQLVTEEGRSFVRRSKEVYDAIISVHTISNAAVASGALSLAENYVLTREAFEDYLDHLAPDGVIYMTRPLAQIPRLFATAREVFERRGWGSPAAHLVAFGRPAQPGVAAPAGGRDPTFSAGFLLKRAPLTAQEIRGVEQLLRSGGGPERQKILYSPLDPNPGSLYHALATAPDLAAVYRQQPQQLAPATDDCPFFNQHSKWSTLTLADFRDLFTQQRRGRMALEDRPVTEITLLTLLAQSIIIAGLFILLPLWRLSRERLELHGTFSLLSYFAALGLGFIMIELALLQRFTLFLGQPVYTLAVVLSGLLVFSGIGAFAADRLGVSGARAMGWMLLALVAVIGATAFATPSLLALALPLGLPWRIALSLALLAPLGVLLGMPFPAGLRLTGQTVPQLVPWAWGVNGFFTVIGTVSALILGMAFGFKVVLAVAAACYLVALAAIVRSHKVALRQR